MSQPYDFSIRKRPKQARSRVTFDAVVEACTRLLEEMGYQQVTTNHVAERAGVAIASLYEYFPNKDAIVVLVAEDLVQRVLAALGEEVPEVMRQPQASAVSYWIRAVHQVLWQERALLQVFYYEVPYTNRLPAVRAILPQLLAFSERMGSQAGARFESKYHQANLYLMVNLVSNTIIQMILDPPPDIEPTALLATLARRIEQWIASP